MGQERGDSVLIGLEPVACRRGHPFAKEVGAKDLLHNAGAGARASC